MSEQSTPVPEPDSVSETAPISWRTAAILAVLALIAGVWLGRVAFVSGGDPAPRIVEIVVENEDELEVTGTVEYFEEHEVYILTINTMPPSEQGEVFQVWAETDDIVVNAGVLNPTSRTHAFASYSGRYDTLFVTAEPGPLGSEQPTSDQLITADLTELEEEDD